MGAGAGAGAGIVDVVGVGGCLDGWFGWWFWLVVFGGVFGAGFLVVLGCVWFCLVVGDCLEVFALVLNCFGSVWVVLGLFGIVWVCFGVLGGWFTTCVFVCFCQLVVNIFICVCS